MPEYIYSVLKVYQRVKQLEPSEVSISQKMVK